MTATPPKVPLDVWLKLGAPLFLVALALLIWIEPWLPGADWIARNLGPTAVLRFAAGLDRAAPPADLGAIGIAPGLPLVRTD